MDNMHSQTCTHAQDDMRSLAQPIWETLPHEVWEVILLHTDDKENLYSASFACKTTSAVIRDKHFLARWIIKHVGLIDLVHCNLENFPEGIVSIICDMLDRLNERGR